MHNAVFDLDGTLYSENTMVALLERLHGRHAPARAWCLRGSRSLPARALWRALNELTRRDVFRACALATLRGYREDIVLRAVTEYVAELDPKADLEVMGRLEEYRARGARLWLASASLEPIAAAVAQRLGMDGWVGSRPMVREGRYTGSWADDVRGRKLEALRLRFADVTTFDVVTDNFDDADLIDASKRAVAVIEPAHLRRWRARFGDALETIERAS